MEESDVVVRVVDNIADQVAQIEERTLLELMRTYGFGHYTQMYNAGYRVVRERRGHGNVYWVICKDVKAHPQNYDSLRSIVKTSEYENPELRHMVVSSRNRKHGDEDQRSTPLGFFNVAESYWRAAETLKKQKLRTTHSDSPVSFLYYHAIELYLKSFLRMHGHSARELRGRHFGHRTCCLSERAAKLGLFFMDEDMEVLSLMATTDAVIRSRYLQTGYFQWPSPEALDRTCRSLRESVGKEMKKAGIPVRMRR